MENDGSTSNELAYDLRQRYAKIVGDHMEDISYARRERNYPEWFRALENLYTITEYKFTENKKKKLNEKIEEVKDEDCNYKFKGYSDLRTELIKVATTYTETWKGNIDTSEEVAKIESALRKIEEWIYKKMDDAKMFGSKRDLEGL